VVFIETSVFTKRVIALLDDDQYRELQNYLAAHPEFGKIIPGSGGLRKVRWAARGRGKRGGLRVIYFWWMSKERISMLFIYAKNEQEDLTASQLKQLKQALED
jgi:mRNA-degrading endonuclease RelE of RelBE toxin-antitoxin system